MEPGRYAVQELLVGDDQVRFLRGERTDRPPVVLVHGLGGCAAVWSRNIPALGSQYEIFAPELWGAHRRFGGKRLTVETGVAFLVGFMDAIGSDSAHLVGVSLGGLLCGMVAARYPNRVKSLTLIGAAGLGRRIAWSQRLLTLPFVGEFFFRPTERRAESMLRYLMPDTDDFGDLVQQIAAVSREEGVTRQMLSALRAGVDIRGIKTEAMLRPHLRAIAAPTLLCWGDRDPLFPVAQAAASLSLLRQASLRIFPGAGHWPFFQQPSEFNKALLEFLSEAERTEG